MEITLRDVTADNFMKVIQVRVHESQQNFVFGNLFSIAESKFHPHYKPFAVYDGEEIVGFAMYDAESFFILRLLIGEAFQGKGYGRAAMNALLKKIRDEHPECTALTTSIHDHNEAAGKLYESLGFVRTGETFGEDAEIGANEVILRLQLV